MGAFIRGAREQKSSAWSAPSPPHRGRCMVQEVVTEAAAALGDRLLLWAGMSALALLLLLAEWKFRERRPAWRRWMPGGLFALAVGLGLWRAWSVLWLADDAFISF